MGREDLHKHRRSLSIRAERAFGLEAVVGGSHPVIEEISPAPVRLAQVAPQLPSRPQPAAQAVKSVEPAVERARSSVVDLFGRAPKSVPDAGSATSPNASPFDAPVLSTEQKRETLQHLNETQVKGCPKCRLCQTRTNTVFGEGDVDAKIFFIGEGPGETEDETGRPFVGRAGQLLTKMIEAMGMKREQVFIANIVKCRPPGNREPAPDETAACTPYLLKQLEVVRPKVIVTLGKPATQYMLQSKESMGRMRGQWHTWRGIKLMPTFHPSYVLRQYTPEVRRTVWGDLQLVLEELKLPAPKRADA